MPGILRLEFCGEKLATASCLLPIEISSLPH